MIPREFHGLITAPNIETMTPKANARLEVLQPASVLVDLYTRQWLLVVTTYEIYEFRFDGAEWSYWLVAQS